MLSETSLQVISEAKQLQEYVIVQKRRRLEPEVLYHIIKEKYLSFHDNFPALFNMIVEDGSGFDFKRLEWMLTQKEKMDSGSISRQKSDELVGNIMATAYNIPTE